MKDLYYDHLTNTKILHFDNEHVLHTSSKNDEESGLLTTSF